MIFKRSGSVLIRNPIALRFFRGGGPDPLPGSAHDQTHKEVVFIILKTVILYATIS